MNALDELTGNYGQYWRLGILSEHQDQARRMGVLFEPGENGSEWAHYSDGLPVPVVCSELIWVDTEDGPITGRCGEIATRQGACEYHASIIDSYYELYDGGRSDYMYDAS